MLESQSYKVSALKDGDAALTAIQNQLFDLIVLDVDLPGVDGFSILSAVRSKTKTPVIMLTAYGAEEHRIRGLRSGADDYVTKPCSFTELSLRIEAVLRRTDPQSHPSQLKTYRYEEIELDRSEHKVVLHLANRHSTIEMTPIQFQLLWTLATNHGFTQSKPFLYQTVLQREFSPYDRSLDMHMSRVRKRLIAEGLDPLRIQTVHGKGYLLK